MDQVDSTPSSSNATQRKRNKRGPNVSLKTKRMKPNEIRQVMVNIYGQGDDGYVAEFITYLGTLVRNGLNLPYNYHDWRKVPAHYKEKLWNKIQRKYQVDVLGKKWVYVKMGLQWKAFKRELRKECFDDVDSIDEAIKNCPSMIPLDQWKDLVDIWSSEKNKKMRFVNTDIRKLQKMTHTCGRRSYAQRFRMKTKEHPEGVEPKRIEMYFETHTRKDETPVDPISAKLMRGINKDLANLPKEKRNDVSVLESIFTTHLGPDTHGRVRSRGAGVSPKDFGLTKTQQNKQLNGKLVELTQKLQQVEQEREEEKRQREEEKRQREEEKRQREEEKRQREEESRLNAQKYDALQEKVELLAVLLLDRNPALANQIN